MPRVIMFVFAGRRPNMELQLPFIRRILDEHPTVEYHVWNLCRSAEDAAYVRSIEGDRITVRDDFYDKMPGWNHVFWHYGNPEYQDALFVKLDDDVVFLETDGFSAFTDAIVEHPDAVVSAKVVNNGACTPLIPPLWERFERMGIPLLDVHMSNAYSEYAHTWFIDHADELLGQPVKLIPTEDWLSINAIGYSWLTGRRIGAMLDRPVSGIIAGRHFPQGARMGDEGRCNMLRRYIVQGFTVGHLTFGPQAPSAEQLDRWRSGYQELATRYLADQGRPADRSPGGTAQELQVTRALLRATPHAG